MTENEKPFIESFDIDPEKFNKKLAELAGDEGKGIPLEEALRPFLKEKKFNMEELTFLVAVGLNTLVAFGKNAVQESAGGN